MYIQYRQAVYTSLLCVNVWLPHRCDEPLVIVGGFVWGIYNLMYRDREGDGALRKSVQKRKWLDSNLQSSGRQHVTVNYPSGNFQSWHGNPFPMDASSNSFSLVSVIEKVKIRPTIDGCGLWIDDLSNGRNRGINFVVFQLENLGNPMNSQTVFSCFDLNLCTSSPLVCLCVFVFCCVKSTQTQQKGKWFVQVWSIPDKKRAPRTRGIY